MRIFLYVLIVFFLGLTVLFVIPSPLEEFVYKKDSAISFVLREEPSPFVVEAKPPALPTSLDASKRVSIATVTPVSTDSSSITVSSSPATIVAHSIPEERSIDLRSVVVIKCTFKGPSGRTAIVYGSGVIIHQAGYILTARHVVDMPYTYRITGGRQGFADYSLDICRVAVSPEGITTPTPEAIRAINPFTPVTDFAYSATVAFVPPNPVAGGMSEAEYDFTDAALMRIIPESGVALPTFIASPVKVFDLPRLRDPVVSFGFPSGVPAYGSNFYLQGSVGEIRDLVGGDALFKDQPVGMTVEMETIGGRSGSPVFWRGYVIGVVSSKEDYSRITAITAAFPIARFAEEAGLAVFK
jgi:hypothetical protein